MQIGKELLKGAEVRQPWRAAAAAGFWRGRLDHLLLCLQLVTWGLLA
jgi:hypothetical protein